jgi:hypothetical protein
VVAALIGAIALRLSVPLATALSAAFVTKVPADAHAGHRH